MQIASRLFVSLVGPLALLAFADGSVAAEDGAPKVTIGAAAEGTASYKLATGLAKVATKGAGLQADVVAEARAGELLRLLNEGKLHFAVADATSLGAAYMGPEAAARSSLPHCPNLRLVMHASPPSKTPDVYLATHKSASDEEVRRLLEAIWNDAESLEPINPAVNEWKRDSAVSAAMTAPYHPAAVVFYNRSGVWSAAADEAQQRLLATNP